MLLRVSTTLFENKVELRTQVEDTGAGQHIFNYINNFYLFLFCFVFALVYFSRSCGSTTNAGIYCAQEWEYLQWMEQSCSSRLFRFHSK